MMSRCAMFCILTYIIILSLFYILAIILLYDTCTVLLYTLLLAADGGVQEEPTDIEGAPLFSPPLSFHTHTHTYTHTHTHTHTHVHTALPTHVTT